MNYGLKTKNKKQNYGKMKNVFVLGVALRPAMRERRFSVVIYLVFPTFLTQIIRAIYSETYFMKK